MRCLILAALPAIALAQQPADSPVIALGNFAHAVASLDKTVPFYRDVLGLPVQGANDPLAQKPQPLDADLSRFTATKGASFRSATFTIPYASFRFELTEFTSTARKPDRFALQDPGAATLVLQVRDIDRVLARVKAAGAEVVSTGGSPIYVATNSNTREVVVRDPDGFFVELQQPDPFPADKVS